MESCCKGEHNNLAPRQQPFILSANLADADLVRQWLHYRVNGLKDSSQHCEPVRPVSFVNKGDIAQSYTPSFVTVHSVEMLERLEERLQSGDRDEDKILIDAILTKGSIELSRMHWFNITNRVLNILGLVDLTQISICLEPVVIKQWICIDARLL